MSKFSIAQQPEFVLEVSIPRIGGEAAPVPFTFHFLEREKFASYLDRKEAHRQEMLALIRAEASSVTEVTKRATAFQLKELKGIIKDWGFTEPYNAKNLAALVGSMASVPEAIFEAFERGYAPARLGN